MNASRPGRVTLLAAWFAAFLAAGHASAQAWRWHYVDGLEVNGRALPLAAYGDYQGGYAYKGGVPLPVLWKGGSQVAVNLLPQGRSSGQVYAMSADRQVGYAASPNTYHAAAWRGTPESYVDLNPSGFRASYAYGVRGDQIAGYAKPITTGEPHAVIWAGPADTFTDLHNNTLATMSYAYATDGEYQGGEAAFRAAGQIHATLWHGSASTMIDMHPSWGGSTYSEILGMAPGVQVGTAAGIPVLWHGSADSAQKMSPRGYTVGELHDTDGTHHVGLAQKNGTGYAGIWMSDDRDSFVNLGSMIAGDNIWGSNAYAIYSSDTQIVVVGEVRVDDSPSRGVVWVRDIPAPYPASLIVVGLVAMGRRRERGN